MWHGIAALLYVVVSASAGLVPSGPAVCLCALPPAIPTLKGDEVCRGVLIARFDDDEEGYEIPYEGLGAYVPLASGDEHSVSVAGRYGAHPFTFRFSRWQSKEQEGHASSRQSEGVLASVRGLWKERRLGLWLKRGHHSWHLRPLSQMGESCRCDPSVEPQRRIGYPDCVPRASRSGRVPVVD